MRHALITGHAADHVAARCLIRQQDQPPGHVVAPGIQHGGRDFVPAVAQEIGLPVAWRGTGMDESGMAVAHLHTATRDAPVTHHGDRADEFNG